MMCKMRFKMNFTDQFLVSKGWTLVTDEFANKYWKHPSKNVKVSYLGAYLDEDPFSNIYYLYDRANPNCVRHKL